MPNPTIDKFQIGNTTYDFIDSTARNTADAAVPQTRKVNNKALSADVTLTSDDIGYDSTETYSSGTIGNELTQLSTAITALNLFDNNNYTSGYRISSQGADYQDPNYFVSNYIAVQSGTTYAKNSPTADAHHRFATYDSSKTFIRKVDDSNSITIAEDEAFIRFSGKLDELPTTTLVNDSKPVTAIDYDARNILNNSLLVEKPNTSYTDGIYINASNNNLVSSSGFGVLNPIPLKKYQTIFLTTKGYSNTTGMLAICDSTNSVRSTMVTSIDGNRRTYSYTAHDDCYVTGTIRSTEQYDVEIYISIPNVLGENTIEYPQIFSKVLFIGDSITAGYDGQTTLNKNYPYYFEKLAQCEINNQGSTGFTAKQWWDNIGTTFDFSSYDCAIIYLGTNGGLTDTVSTDCNADYTQCADTNTGCYGKIISKIKTDAPNCKIFCIAGPAEYVRRTYNSVIREIVDFYNVNLIDIEDCILSDDGSTSSAQRVLYRPIDGIHYDTLGYLTFANVVYSTMKDVIASNLAIFKTA